MLSMPWHWRQLGVAYTAQPGVANTPQPACLIDGLVGAGATQLPWPIGSQDHHGHLALSGLNHSWQQVGHSCARACDDGGRSSADTTWWMHRTLMDVGSGAPSCSMSVAWTACGSELQGPGYQAAARKAHACDQHGGACAQGTDPWALPKPRAQKARDRSSMHGTTLARGCSATAVVSAEEREPAQRTGGLFQLANWQQARH